MTSLISSRALSSALTASLIVVAALVPCAARAFSIAPFMAELRPSGLESSRAFTVENRYDHAIAVEVSAKKRAQSADGEETRTPTDELVVSPVQLSLKAGEKRIVRVTYVGKRDLQDELAYRVIFEQLPINLNKPERDTKTGAKFEFVFNYIASLYVAPAGLKSDLRVEETKPLDGGKIRVVLRNHGTAHQQLSEYDFALASGPAPTKYYREWEKDVLETLAMVNVLAGGERALTLKLPKDAPKDAAAVGSLKAVLNKKPQS